MEKQSLKNLDSIKKLQEKYNSLSKTHMRSLLSNQNRNDKLNIKAQGIYLDYSHEKLDTETIELLKELAAERDVLFKFNKMMTGEKINTTEGRRVLHHALRLAKHDKLTLDNIDIVQEVHSVLDRIKQFSEDIRSGAKTGHTGKKLKNIVSIGIGGSYLGTEFVYNSLRNHTEYEKLSEGFKLRFLANVCPIDFFRAIEGFDIEETLFIIISKTFTTAETMLNARNCKNWLLNAYKDKHNISESDNDKVISKHFCAVSTNLEATSKFGIEKENVFGFWDWVGGRYSVWSAVGALPLSIVFSYPVFEQFLSGGRYIDTSIATCMDVTQCIPVMLGLLGFYNTFIRNKTTRVILPYSQALCRFANHVQQLDMESNGKSVSITTNDFLDYECGPVVFGEPGTNGQHSFYQLIHQGRELSCEFIAHAKAQRDIKYEGEPVSSHEELMCNFFAQPDALAFGKFKEELTVGENLINHMTFKGDRTSLSIMFEELNAFAVGQLLAIYEHRVACEGFLYDINSFDQWGVELGKKLATDVRKVLAEPETADTKLDKFNSSTSNLIKYFLKHK
jgi:glucose-6-phosphate isomerase